MTEPTKSSGWLRRCLECACEPRLWAALLVATLVGSLGYQHLTDPRPYFRLGLEGVQQNDRNKVEVAVAKLASHAPFQAQQAYLQGWLQLQGGQAEEALGLALSAQAHPDVEVDARVLAGQAAYRLGAAGNAKLFWEEALALDPDCLSAHQWLGVLYYDVGAMDNALNHLRVVSRLSPEDPRPDRFMGLINRDYERPDVAIPHYQESLRRNPNQPGAERVWLELAECQIKQRDYEDAIESLSHCGASVRKMRLTARCLLNLGELDDARAIARQALGIEPNDLDALQLNAEIALADGEVETAEKFLQTAIRVDPFDHGAHTQLAQVLGRLGRESESRQQSERAEELQQQWQRFSDLQIDAINRPTDAPLRYEIGLFARQLGKSELAASWFKAALSIDPGYALAAEALAKLSGASVESEK